MTIVTACPIDGTRCELVNCFSEIIDCAVSKAVVPKLFKDFRDGFRREVSRHVPLNIWLDVIVGRVNDVGPELAS